MSRPILQGETIGVLLVRWAPPFLWMAVASWLSTDGFSAEQTGGYLIPLLHWLFPTAAPATVGLLHAGIRKGMHVLEFGVLAWLWYRALKWGQTGWRVEAAARAFILAAGFGAADEVHQVFEPHRTGAVTDVGWDSLGALSGLTGCWLLRRETARGDKPDAPGGVPPGGVWRG